MEWNIPMETLAAMGEAERNAALQGLQESLHETFGSETDHHQWGLNIKKAVEKLRKLGYDLWGWDYDGEAAYTWGWDYMKPPGKSRLVITFRFKELDELEWQDEPTNEI